MRWLSTWLSAGPSMITCVFESSNARLERSADDSAESAATSSGHTTHGRFCLHGSHGALLRQNSTRALWASLAVS